MHIMFSRCEPFPHENAIRYFLLQLRFDAPDAPNSMSLKKSICIAVAISSLYLISSCARAEMERRELLYCVHGARHGARTSGWADARAVRAA